MSLERKKPLRANPETTKAWQRRSQDAARERAREQPRSVVAAAAAAKSRARKPPPDPVPDAVKAEVDARSGGRCEVRLEGCGDRYGYQRHHRLKRRSGIHTAANLVGVCANCHTGSPAAIHRNVAWSETVGLLIRSTDPAPTEAWERPQDFPPGY